MAERKFTISAKEVKLTDGRSFIKCSAIINNKWYKIKFKKECLVTPKIKGRYDIKVIDEDLSLQKGKTVKNENNTFIENDTLWVSKCELRQWTEEELKAEEQVKITDVFTEKLTPTEDNGPF